MIRHWTIIMVLLLLSCILSSFVLGNAVSLTRSSTNSDGTIVNLSYGSFQGNASGYLTSFLGIPFAEPPTGKLRFARPQAPKKINGIQQATAFGPACFQQNLSEPNMPGIVYPVTGPAITNMSEDCLSVNVVRPKTIPKGHVLPVLSGSMEVCEILYSSHVHSTFGTGDFEVGGTSMFDPTPLVQRFIDLGQPLIYVSANYRLNVFGFLSSKEVKDAGTSNLGLVDQRFALQWVHDNIALFGGDPSRVIIWGESAGAFSVGLQMLMNNGNTEGLFHGAFMESGSPFALPDITEGQPFYDQLVSDANCTNAVDTLDFIRDAPTEVILDFVNGTPSLFDFRSLNAVWEPAVDGNVIPRNPQDSVAQGAYAKIPTVSGDCDDEGTLFSLTALNITTEEEILDYIAANYVKGANASELASVAQAYPDDPTLGSPFGTGTANQLSPQFKRLASFVGDWQFQSTRRFFLRTISKTQDTYAFLYRRGKSSFGLGASHGSDIVEFYSTLTDPDFIATDALISFAYTLNPGSKSPKSLLSAIDWPLWDANPFAPPLLTFNDPAPNVNITADNYREGPMNLLIQLSRTLF